MHFTSKKKEKNETQPTNQNQHNGSENQRLQNKIDCMNLIVAINIVNSM